MSTKINKKAAYSKAYYEANREKRKAYNEANKEKILVYSKDHYEANKEKRNAQDKAHYEANKEKIALRKKAYKQANPEKVLAQKRAAQKTYREENPEAQRAITAKRRAAKLQATPPWYSHTDCVAIYKELKPGYNVDHITPLQGENVSGLHWHHNLQLLPAAENIAKSNKFDPDTYVHELPFY